MPDLILFVVSLTGSLLKTVDMYSHCITMLFVPNNSKLTTSISLVGPLTLLYELQLVLSFCTLVLLEVSFQIMFPICNKLDPEKMAKKVKWTNG